MNKTRQDGNALIPLRPGRPFAVSGNIPKRAPRPGATSAIIHNDEFVVAKSHGGRVGCNRAITLRLIRHNTEASAQMINWSKGGNSR
jgi:hypothetical protein